MKKTLTLLVLILGLASANAQEQPKFQKNQFNIQNGYNSLDETPKINATFGYERWLNSEVSIGLNLNYFQSKNYDTYIPNNYGNFPSTNDKSIGISVSLNYDWSKMIGLDTTKFDLYTGVSLGRSRIIYKDFYEYSSGGINSIKSSETTSDELFVGGKIGARYWFTKNIGVNLELDQSFETLKDDNVPKLNLGVNFKF